MNKDIIAIIREAAAMGAAEVTRRLRPEDDRISEREAFRIYGRGFVKANADRLTVTANGNRKDYSRAELEQVKAARSVAVLAIRIEETLKQSTL